MTTIACDRKAMASDSRVVVDGFDYLYNTTKIIRVKGAIVGGAGDGENTTLLMEWAKSGFKTASRPNFRKKDKDNEDDDVDAILLVLRQDGIFLITNSDSEPERIEGDFYAIGSGHSAAMTAMRMGADPKTAVEMAIEVDSKSGPPVQVLTLKEET